MLEKRTITPIHEAVTKVMNHVVSGGSKEYVRIEECFGRYLAEDLIADHDVPPFDKSPYDGFAIIAEDTTAASSDKPIQLEVMEEIGAGRLAHTDLKRGQAIRIMTGAKIPLGANAVVMLELVKERKVDNKVFIEIKRSVRAGDNISRQGSDVTNGATLIPKGTKINEGTIALLATFGYRDVAVFKKPLVGIIATGSELLEVDEPLEPGKIRNSNAYMIEAQVKKLGAEVKYYGKIADDLELCTKVMKQAFTEVDILITTGGVSVGDFDYLPEIYNRINANILFNKVAMRPGSVTTVAEKEGKLLFGLSGNPSACFVGFELFARPAILRYFETKKLHLQKERAILGADFLKANPFTRFVRSKVAFEDGKLTGIPVGLDKSGVVSSLAFSNALLILPGGTRGYKQGMEVEALLLNGEGSEWPWGQE